MAKRKTKAEWQAQRTKARRGVWDLYRAKLEAAKNMAEAQQLAAEPLPDNSPGRPYYLISGVF